ncbi:Crp/Fnr family transcriptional regulator [Mesorhizobium sp. 1B3]|uniref:Crp/Fnr family transcriptional regulator n=1 Tax=Mesorhizobium sp. 1B3 TaxID=3243599 RepID=UPI003D993E13
MTADLMLFRRNPWLAGLSPDTMTHLASRAIVRRLAHGELWVSRSELAGGIAVIVAGGLRSTTFTAEGKEYVFSIMKEGDIWGLVSTIDGIHNANDVYAHGETTLVTIDRRTTLAAMEQFPDLGRCLMGILCHRLRMANTVLEDRALKPIEVRLARLLLSLRGSRQEASDSYEVAVTQEMLSKILGCTRPTVNKKLRQLEQEEIVSVSYGFIRIENPARIAVLAGRGDYQYF